MWSCAAALSVAQALAEQRAGAVQKKGHLQSWKLGIKRATTLSLLLLVLWLNF